MPFGPHVSESFFRALDAAWRLDERATLNIIGGTALRLGHAHTRVTDDADILETVHLSLAMKEELSRLGGKGTALAKRHGVYIALLASGIPFLPRAPKYNDVSFEPPLVHLVIRTLDAVDVCVSKLKRFHANDRSDIEAMVTAGHVTHAELVSRFRSAVDDWSYGAYASDLPKYVAALNTVERDMFVVEETTIDLPDWLDR